MTWFEYTTRTCAKHNDILKYTAFTGGSLLIADTVWKSYQIHHKLLMMLIDWSVLAAKVTWIGLYKWLIIKRTIISVNGCKTHATVQYTACIINSALYFPSLPLQYVEWVLVQTVLSLRLNSPLFLHPSPSSIPPTKSCANYHMEEDQWQHSQKGPASKVPGCAGDSQHPAGRLRDVWVQSRESKGRYSLQRPSSGLQ